MSHLSTFISRRFEELHALLNARGYLLDFGGRELPRWADDPPLGLIHIRAVLLPDADEDEDADPDERISFTLTERWSEYPVGEAQDREGLYLCSYSYHGQVEIARIRYEFDPDGHPEIPITAIRRGSPTTSANQQDQLHPKLRSMSSTP